MIDSPTITGIEIQGIRVSASGMRYHEQPKRARYPHRARRDARDVERALKWAAIGAAVIVWAYVFLRAWLA